jgi:hypothetical protein
VYVNSLFLRDTHETTRTYRSKRNIWCNIVQARLNSITLNRRSVLPNSRLSMESNCWPQYGSYELKLFKIGANFKYINSLLAKRRMIGYFRKNMSKIPIDNGSSLNILITLKIIALANITLIETSVSVV